MPLLNSRQVFQVDPLGIKYIARGAHLRDLEEITLRENMLLVTRSGTNGRVQIVPRYMDGWAGSEDLAWERIRAAPHCAAHLRLGYLARRS
jgi:type I restriction enzyme S subunit